LNTYKTRSNDAMSINYEEEREYRYNRRTSVVKALQEPTLKNLKAALREIQGGEIYQGVYPPPANPNLVGEVERLEMENKVLLLFLSNHEVKEYTCYL